MQPASKLFRSFDQGVAIVGDYVAPDRFRQLEETLSLGKPLIARGAGLSYVPASFGADSVSVEMGQFNRIMAIEPERVTVEAGIAIGDLQAVLSGRDRMLAVQPGYPKISVGGCIACNVNGKNQYRDGQFCDWVDRILLLRAGEEMRWISRSEEGELFAATCGGFGLTGIIVAATLRTVALPARWIRQSVVEVTDLRDTAEAMLARRDEVELLYSWNDLSIPGRSCGAGFVYAGQYEASTRPLPPQHCYGFGRRAQLPVSAVNDVSIPWINRIYRVMSARAGAPVPLFDFLYPAARQGYYFDLFGRQGFFETQSLVPLERWTGYVARLLRLQAQAGVPVALASVKLFRGQRKLLGYGGDGISLALDFVRNERSLAFAAQLDELNCDEGAISCIYKDSRIAGATVKRQYPGYDAFRDQLARFNGGRYASALSERLGL